MSELTATKVTVTNQAGKARIVLDGTEALGKITMFDDNGEPRLSIMIGLQNAIMLDVLPSHTGPTQAAVRLIGSEDGKTVAIQLLKPPSVVWEQST